MKKFDSLRVNKFFLDQMNKFLLDLENDPKIKDLDLRNYRIYFCLNYQGGVHNGMLIIKSDVLEFLRLRFLSILFIEDNEARYQVLKRLDDNIKNAFSYNGFFIGLSSILTNNINDTNDIYLYSDLIGKYNYENLKELSIEKDPINFLYNELVLNDNDEFHGLFICFSMIKKEQYKNRKLEELKSMTDLGEVVDFIVNVEPTIEIEDKHQSINSQIKEFQNMLEMGYFNNYDLIMLLIDITIKLQIKIKYISKK